jgi:hypothetical protein
VPIYRLTPARARAHEPRRRRLGGAIGLAASIAKTFENRGAELDSDPVALTEAFTTAGPASNQWTAFIRRSNLDAALATLEELREPVRQFLVPVITAITEDRDFTGSWPAGGPRGFGS